MAGSSELPAGPPASLATLRKLTQRKYRQQHRQFLAEGHQAVAAALAAPMRPLRLVLASDTAAQRFDGLLARVRQAGVPIRPLTERQAEQLAGTVHPQGLVALCDYVDVDLEQALSALRADPPGLAVLLHRINDPGNAGTVLRSAEAAGAGAVMLSAGSVDPYNGKTVRACAGALFSCPVVRGIDTAAAISGLRRAGFYVIAADGGGADLDHAVEDGRLGGGVAWLFGNEAGGLPGELRQACDAVLAVPIRGRVESLNLAAAAAVCLFTTARAQRPADGSLPTAAAAESADGV